MTDSVNYSMEDVKCLFVSHDFLKFLLRTGGICRHYIHNNFFDHLSSNIPQMPLLDLSSRLFLPRDNDFKIITK